MPWWSDPGEWLKYANGIEAYLSIRAGFWNNEYETMLYTMWDQGVFQYPPLFFLILIVAKTFLGSLQALKILGSLLFALQPVPIYFVTKKITSSEIGGLIAAYTVSFFPLNIEMLGWGGYPNLLGLLLLSTNIYFTIASMDSPIPKNIYLMIISSILIPLTHHLTSGIHFGILLLWISLLILIKNFRIIKYPLYNLILALITFVAYRISFAHPSQFVTFNEAAYYSLRVNLIEILAYVFKFYGTFILILIIASYILVKRNKLINKNYQALLFSWILFPILATQAYFIGLAIDYNRIFFFSLQPLPIIIAIPFASLSKIKETLIRNIITNLESSFVEIIAIIISILALTSILLTGINTMANVAGWYSSQDPYGDNEKYLALNWIKYNTPSDSIFIADEYIGRWIEGFCSRRTYLYMEPRFLFIKGQIERYYIASTILLGVHEIRNCYLRIFDQTPYNISYSPIVCFWVMGEYKQVLELDDKDLSRDLKNFVVTSVANKTNLSIHVQYKGKNALQDIIIGKTIMLEDEYKLKIEYDTILQNLTVYINLSQKRAINLIEIMSQQINIHTDIGKIIVITNAKEVENVRDKILKLSSNTSKLQILVFMENPEKNSLDKTLLIEAKKLLAENNIKYIVLPRLSNMGIESLPQYQHLLKRYKIVYLNNKVMILEV
ncbi:MAG: hypothetical protein QXV52_06045 [Nitrososphaeria archaeon]